LNRGLRPAPLPAPSSKARAGRPGGGPCIRPAEVCLAGRAEHDLETQGSGQAAHCLPVCPSKTVSRPAACRLPRVSSPISVFLTPIPPCTPE
jgi:hypothetical protein